MQGCQYIGPEQDPLRDWPIKYCGHKTIEGQSYCGDHYWKIYRKGSATAGRKREKEVDAEIAELKRLQELEEAEDV